MIWYAKPKEADYPEQDCYSCIHKCPCDAFAKFNDGGPYPPPCDTYELPPDCRECGQRMEADFNEGFYCEACEQLELEQELAAKQLTDPCDDCDYTPAGCSEMQRKTCGVFSPVKGDLDGK